MYQVFGNFRRHGLTLQKAAFIVEPLQNHKSLRIVFTTYSLGHFEGERRITQCLSILGRINIMRT
jgi:hypothetical protein